MKLIRFFSRSLIHFWKSNLLVVLGAAISTMVLTGTLIVGDSMRFSLEKTTEYRLGNIDYVFSGGDRYFRSQLANEIINDLNIDAASILQVIGIASSQGGKYKLNNIQVLGIDEHFSSMRHDAISPTIPKENEAFISENLSDRLQLKTGDAFQLRIEKVSLVPKNAPFVSNTDNYISIRMKVAAILSEKQLGRFNLNTSQTAPFNVFISNSYLNEKLDWDGKANKLLLSGDMSENEILKSIEDNWKLTDMSLSISQINNNQNLEIKSDRVFIDSSTVNKIKLIAPDAREILTYMANSFTHNEKSTPYSFISAGPFSNQLEGDNMIINSWMADDLKAQAGDSIEMAYFSIGPLRKLIEKKHKFVVKEIVRVEGIFAERSLMPDLPGLSDAGSCREWEAGVPISLDAIRDKDEDYWNKYRGTPKAFISYKTGKELWENRFGVCTAIRLPENELNEEHLDNQLSKIISPADVGFALHPVKEEGLKAARGGVDFSQLFMGLSFFLLAAALILMSLLFNLHLEKRIGELGTLKATGFPFPLIKKIFLMEGLLIALPGVVLGALLAILYNQLIFLALNTVWQDIVRTSVLQESVQPLTLLFGVGISLILIISTIWRNTIRRLKTSSADLQRKLKTTNAKKFITLFQYGGIVFLIGAIALLIYAGTGSNQLNTGLYFGAGTLLLVGSLFYMGSMIKKPANSFTKDFNSFSLLTKNITRNSSRSLRVIILFALGTFVIISTGLNKKDLYRNANQLGSGTGGFQFYMETTLPMLTDLNDPEVQANQGIDLPLRFIQLRKIEGDDASCLNLNRVTSPRILGIPSNQLEGRFSFVSQTDDLNLANPWSSLQKELPGNVVPAILDQTVIQWGLGKKVGDTLVYKNELGHEMKLKIIGGLANSIFQGNVLIDEQLFLKNFPSNSGSHVFLIDGNQDQADENSDLLHRAFRNDGMELEYTADRLAKFNQIENTYLSIFLLLGGLAMILGTVGLGISLARNLLDRGKEIGILRAMGFGRNKIFKIISLEHLILLFSGTVAGAFTAFISTLPSFLSGINQNSWLTAVILLLVILVNGLIWILMISRSFLKKNLLITLRIE